MLVARKVPHPLLWRRWRRVKVFLDNLTMTTDQEVSQWHRIYQLEDIRVCNNEWCNFPSVEEERNVGTLVYVPLLIRNLSRNSWVYPWKQLLLKCWSAGPTILWTLVWTLWGLVTKMYMQSTRVLAGRTKTWDLMQYLNNKYALTLTLHECAKKVVLNFQQPTAPFYCVRLLIKLAQDVA